MSTNLTQFSGNGTGYGNITLLHNPSLCTLQTCGLSMASFLYIPTLPGNLLYAIIFALLLVRQCWVGILHKTWGFLAAMLCGLLLEVLGYVARLKLHSSPFDHGSFLLYLICLTITPAFFTAAIYLCLARIIQAYGEHLARIKPRTYTIIFCACDIVSLVLQGMGGGVAATANTHAASDLGKDIMLAGLIFQICSLAVFAVCCGEFAYRVWRSQRNRNPDFISITSLKRFKLFLVGLLISSITILIRSMYRCAELAGGFNSRLFTSDEALFMVLEGAMIIIATTCLTIFHPAIGFHDAWNQANFSFRTKKAGVTGDSSLVSSAEELQTLEPCRRVAEFKRL